MSDLKTPDNQEQSVDGGIEKALASKGIYNAAQNIGGAALDAGKAAATVDSANRSSRTVMGAAANLAGSLVAKPFATGLLVTILILVMVFRSLPSMFFESPVDVADITGPVEVYRQYKEYAMEKYGEELDTRKQEIEEDFKSRMDGGEFEEYDHVEFTYAFNPTEDDVMAELMEASTLIIAMFEIHTDDWRKASFSHFKSAVDSVYFWNDTIAVSKANEETEMTHKDGESTLHIHITYDIFDKGVEAFRSKFGFSDDGDYLKSVEMAYNIKIFFGEADGMPMGGVTGGAAGSYPGGGTHSAIRQALAALEEPKDFFGGAVIIPLQTYSRISSEFGPRNYAPDPIHTGIDFSAASGTPIYSAMDGIILLKLTNMNTFGNHIVVYHGGGITTMYAHMSSFGSYSVGDTVLRGDVIGYVGRSGLSTGDHLHFEYQISGTAHNPRLILPL